MAGCNMNMYVMDKKKKMLEYVSVCKIQVSVAASEGVSARSTDGLVWSTGRQGCQHPVCGCWHKHTILTTFLFIVINATMLCCKVSADVA